LPFSIAFATLPLWLKLLAGLGQQLKASLLEHVNASLWITFLALVALPFLANDSVAPSFEQPSQIEK